MEIDNQTRFDSALDEAVVQCHQYITRTWPKLTRQDDPQEPDRLLLPQPYVFPSTEMFPYQFYWDSYFTILGLAVDGHADLIDSMVENFFYEIEQYGFVLNYNHPRSLGRSQPPYLSRMIWERLNLAPDRTGWLERGYELAARDFLNFWMPRRSTAIGLCRYLDHDAPDDEIRAQYESGWDHSSRWASRCRFLAAVDLNCNLYQYLRDLAGLARLLGRAQDVKRWTTAADQYAMRIRTYLLDPDTGLYCDYDVVEERLMRERLSLAAFHPLYVGLASSEEAAALMARLDAFEQAGGLTCTPEKYDEAMVYQWDWPNGWAPLHWVAIKGMQRYGYLEEAGRIARKWLSLCADNFEKTGRMWEKYDVVAGSSEAVTEYRQQHGFGWTNGVFSALLGRVVAGLEYDSERGRRILEPMLCEALFEHPFRASFGNYLAEQIDVEIRYTLDQRRVAVSLAGAGPVCVRIRDLFPDMRISVTDDGAAVTYERAAGAPPVVEIQLDDQDRHPIEVIWSEESIAPGA